MSKSSLPVIGNGLIPKNKTNGRQVTVGERTPPEVQVVESSRGTQFQYLATGRIPYNHWYFIKISW